MEQHLERFRTEVRGSGDEPRLDYAALLIAAGEYPDLHTARYIADLDAMAEEVQQNTPAGATPRMLAGAIRRHLFEKLGFRGNQDDYYDPRNSYLNDVIERRTGIPISLAAVFLEVARRVGLDAAGVSYPRHFLVKYRDGAAEWLVDAFLGGEEFSADEFRDRLVRGGGADEQTASYFLAGVTRRQILARMLLNLKMIYLEREDFPRALRVQEYTLALNPWSFTDIRDRGVLRGQTGDITGALTDLETYLAHAGPSDDTATVRRMVAGLRDTEGQDRPL